MLDSHHPPANCRAGFEWPLAIQACSRSVMPHARDEFATAGEQPMFEGLQRFRPDVSWRWSSSTCCGPSAWCRRAITTPSSASAAICARLQPGLGLIFPFIDRVGAQDNMMERVLDVPSQEVITRDNAMVKVDGIAFYQVLDAAKAAYEVNDLENAILNLTMTNIRTVMGSMDLDSLLSQRDEINHRLLGVVDQAAHALGRQDDPHRDQGHRSAARSRRFDGAADEGRAREARRHPRGRRQRQAAILKAEGEKQSVVLEAEGRREAAFRDAEARERSAEAEAKATADGQRRHRRRQCPGDQLFRRQQLHEGAGGARRARPTRRC